MQERPTLLNGCARAATASEARYRIDGAIAPSRGRVIALDEGAVSIVDQVAASHDGSSRFYSCKTPASGAGNGSGTAEVVLHGVDGADARLSSELDGADLVFMVATADKGSREADSIGDACARRKIMTVGVIIGQEESLGATLGALRSHARVLMVSRDASDLADMLTAMRA